MLKLVIKIIFLGVLLITQVMGLNAETNASKKIELQSHMQAHLRQLQIGQFIKFIDPSSKSIIDLVPSENHPMIFKGEGIFVLCIDAIDVRGDSYPVDVYVIELDGLYKTVDVKIGHSARAGFEQMMKSGIFQRY